MNQEHDYFSQRERHLLELIELLRDESISEEQFSELQRLVIDDPVARRTYVNAIALQSDLEWRQEFVDFAESLPESFDEELPVDFSCDPGELSQMTAFLPSTLSSANELNDSNSNQGVNNTVIDVITQALPTAFKNVVSSSAFFSGTITFSIGMFAFLIYMLIPSNVQLPSNLARVSQTAEAVWVNGTGDGDLQKLCIGRQLELETGLAQVEYANGVRVNLEGPVLFVISGPNRGILLRGKVSALVKDVPTGFTVQTPIGKVVDLGTEFGVEVADDKDTEVQVFDGKVELDVAGARHKTGGAVTAPQRLALRETEAVYVDADHRVVESASYMPDRFARTYKELKPYYFDGFSEDTSKRYVGTLQNFGSAHSMWSTPEGGFSVTEGKLVAEVDDSTYSIFSRERLFHSDEIFAVNVPATKTGIDVSVVASTAVGEPQGGCDGGIGFRLRREHGKGLVVEKYDSTRVACGNEESMLIDSSRIKDPDPSRSLRLVIQRMGQTGFTFYCELDGIRTKIFGPVSHSELTGVERLYIGMEASSCRAQKQTVVFDDLSVRPINEQDLELTNF